MDTASATRAIPGWNVQWMNAPTRATTMAAAQTVGSANATQAFLVHLAMNEFAPRSAADMALARSYSAIVTTVSQA